MTTAEYIALAIVVIVALAIIILIAGVIGLISTYLWPVIEAILFILAAVGLGKILNEK